MDAGRQNGEGPVVCDSTRIMTAAHKCCALPTEDAAEFRTYTHEV